MDQVSQVREKIDIVGLISSYIPLKKSGRNFTTNCPFHNEKTPSFVVSPERQIWHCFGCGRGGDAYSFLMEYENIEFIEALRTLAKKAGVNLKFTSDAFSSSKKEKIFEVNKIASLFYNFILLKHQSGKQALEYLIKKRGLTSRLINTFGIGFSPTGRRDLSNYLINKKNFSKKDLVDAGLSYEKDGEIFDFFKRRIMFPLIDHRGNIIGFSGRKITDDSFGPKYINTKETEAYHKGSTFFGLNIAKDEIKKQGATLVVEGEFDVISAFSQGIKNTVALKGTAFTEAQALLLSRFSPKILLCFDQDEAGFTALKKSIPIIEKRGLSISVVILDGKDPDEVIKKDPVVFKKAIKNDIEVYDFLLDKLIKENDTQEASGKRKITDDILPLISGIQNEIVKEHYLKKLSKSIDTSYESLLRQLNKKEDEKKEKVFKKIQVRDRREILEEYLLALILQSENPRDSFTKSKDILSSYEFRILSVGKIFAEISNFSKEGNRFNLKSMSAILLKELLPSFDKCFLVPLPKFENYTKYEEEIIRVSKELRIFFLKEKVKKISTELKGKNTDILEIEKIREEITNITMQLSSQ